MKILFSLTALLNLLLFTLFPVHGEDYLIGAGDVLTISVYDHNELKTTVRVANNGNIVFPLINEVNVGGLKISSAAEKIRVLLSDGYIINPQVTIFIEEFKSKKVIILGHVVQPGLIELRGPTSLLELISQAGGLKDGAGETVTIKRVVKGEQQTIAVDLDALLEKGDTTENIQIHGGDTVSIAKSGTCYITGEVNQPGGYPCGKNATLLKIISLAGGFNGKAARSDVNIVRVVNGEKKIFEEVELNTAVQPDDIIVVPESFF